MTQTLSIFLFLLSCRFFYFIALLLLKVWLYVMFVFFVCFLCYFPLLFAFLIPSLYISLFIFLNFILGILLLSAFRIVSVRSLFASWIVIWSLLWLSYLYLVQSASLRFYLSTVECLLIFATFKSSGWWSFPWNSSSPVLEEKYL